MYGTYRVCMVHTHTVYVCLVFPDGLESSEEQEAILRTWIPEHLGDAKMMYDLLTEGACCLVTLSCAE